MRRSELGLVPSVAIGIALGLVTCAVAWLDATVFKWWVDESSMPSFILLMAPFVLIVAVAWLCGLAVRPLRANHLALAIPMIVAAVGSFIYVSINMTALSAKGGVIFGLVFLVSLLEPAAREP